ncbi:MAG: hypothetical protein ACHQX4_08025 [Gemmatimonadales bacterium]
MAAKRSMLIPVLGGGGAIALIAVVGLFASGKLGGSGAKATHADSVPNLSRPDSNRGGTKVPGNTKRERPQPQPRDTTTHTTNPPPGGGNMVAIIEDSANAAVRADQNNQHNVAIRIARWIYTRSEATNKQKTDMAELIATNYENDPAQACEWMRNAAQYAVGNNKTRIQSSITQMACQ